MPLAAGSRFGPYEIVAPLGAGGMGEVYRGLDTRLNRPVAIKVIHSGRNADPQSRQRFEREAQLISRFTHPNICTLYDTGSEGDVDFLVMELLEGESLARKISHGPVAIDQVLRYGSEVAGALAAAHEAGVIHRDLKPGNVMITRSGAKLLDFGLAKWLEPQTISPESETHQQEPMTAEGAVVGTLHYMSPEQLEAKPLDGRSDIFSFGCILYEMVTGSRPFTGSTPASVIGAILHSSPVPIESVQPVSPPALNRVIMKCLAREPSERWQSAADLRDELRWIGGNDSTITELATPAPVQSGRSRWIIPSLLLLLAAVASSVFLLIRRPPAPASPAIRFSLGPPPHGTFEQHATVSEIAVSPDGTKIVFSAFIDSRRQLWLRELNAISAVPLAGTEGGLSPFWSPDGKMVGFFAGNKMKKMALSGGPPETICEGSGGTASWSPNGTIIFSQWGGKTSNAVMRVSAAGGTPRPATPETADWYYWPSFLPDGDHFIFLLNKGLDPKTGIYISSLNDPGQTKLLTAASSPAIVTTGGEMLYVDDGTLLSRKFNLRTESVSSETSLLAENAFLFRSTGAANFSASANGGVVAFERTSLQTRLVWVDRNGREIGTVAEAGIYTSFRLSPDGRRLAMSLADPKTGMPNIWIQELGRNAPNPLTANPHGALTPVWNAAGDSLLVVTVPLTGAGVEPPQAATLALATGKVEFLSSDDGPQAMYGVLPAGSAAIYTVSRDNHQFIEMVSLEPGHRKTPLSNPSFNQREGSVSPDGRWLSLTSDESGRPEIYIEPFQRQGEKLRVSIDGGTEARWSRDGKELYFIGADGNLRKIDFKGAPPASASTPEILFNINSYGMMEFNDFNAAHYDVSLDGQKFLIRKLIDDRDRDPVQVIVRPSAAE